MSTVLEFQDYFPCHVVLRGVAWSEWLLWSVVQPSWWQQLWPCMNHACHSPCGHLDGHALQSNSPCLAFCTHHACCDYHNHTQNHNHSHHHAHTLYHTHTLYHIHILYHTHILSHVHTHHHVHSLCHTHSLSHVHTHHHGHTPHHAHTHHHVHKNCGHTRFHVRNNHGSPLHEICCARTRSHHIWPLESHASQKSHHDNHGSHRLSGTPSSPCCNHGVFRTYACRHHGGNPVHDVHSDHCGVHTRSANPGSPSHGFHGSRDHQQMSGSLLCRDQNAYPGQHRDISPRIHDSHDCRRWFLVCAWKLCSLWIESYVFSISFETSDKCISNQNYFSVKKLTKNN